MTLELRAIQALILRQYIIDPTDIRMGLSSRNVDGRVEGRFGRLRLVNGGVDSRQGGLRARDFARLSGLFTFGAHRGCKGGANLLLLVVEELLEVERTRPQKAALTELCRGHER